MFFYLKSLNVKVISRHSLKKKKNLKKQKFFLFMLNFIVRFPLK